MIHPFALLTLAIAALWLGGEGAPCWRRHAWLGLWLPAIVAALAAGIVQPPGLVWLALLASAAWLCTRAASPARQRTLADSALLVIAAGLMTHSLPGFANPLVLATRFSADALPYRLFLNFDKTSAGLLLLAVGAARVRRTCEWREVLARLPPVLAVTIGTVLALSLIAGYVRFDPKWPRATWLWLWANLCFTCVAEEALFRGFVQARLTERWRGVRCGAGLALATAAILFGLAHAGGGAMYVALASVAGAGYGWAYLRTGRVEASILTHFALNTLHFIAFTYPALAK